MRLRDYYVYIVSNFANTTIYIGVTNDLQRRLFEHRNANDKTLAGKYKLTKLVHFEILDTAEQAINREKQLKNWHRQWKFDLINTQNPEWIDLSEQWR